MDYTDSFAGMWSNPWLHGVFTIVILSLAACFIVATLRVKSVTSAVLIPSLLVTFPALAATMTYMWVVDAYAIGIMLACLAVYLIRKYRFGFLGGIVCIVLSVATYQSFVCFTAGLLVFGAMIDLLENMPVKKVFRNCIRYLICLGIGLLLYIITSKLLYPNMSEYNGISDMGKISLLELPMMILRAYKRIFEYFVLKPFSFTSSMMQILNTITCVIIVGTAAWLIVQKKIYKQKPAFFLLLLLLVLEPLALASIYIMAADAAMSMLMLYQYCLVYMIAVVLLEKWMDTKENTLLKISEKLLVTAIAGSMLLIVYQNYTVSNEAYFRMQIANDRAKAYYNRIMVNVEGQDGYAYGDKIAIMGEFFVKGQPNTNPLSSYGMDDERYVDFSGIALENQVLTTGVRRNFLRFFLGIEIPEITQEELQSIQDSSEFAAMLDYPDKDAIQKINDIWVVKLCYDWETYQKSVLEK